MLLLSNSLSGLSQKNIRLADTIIEGEKVFGYKMQNHFIIPAQFKEAHPFSENMAVVRSGNYYHFINNNGFQIGNCVFADAKSFSEGLAAAKFSSGWGFIDSRTNIKIAPEYNSALPFSEGAAAVKKEKWFFIDKRNDAFPFRYDSIVSGYKNGLAIAGKYDHAWKFGVINKSGNWVIDCHYSSIQNVITTIFLADSSEGYFSVFDQNGKRLFTRVENVQSIGDSLITLEHDGLNYLLDNQARIRAKGFKNLLNNKPVYFTKWKIADSLFRTLVKIEADSFISEGNSIIRCFNYKRQIVFPKNSNNFYSDIKYLNKNRLKVLRNKWGIADQIGNLLISHQYDSVKYIHPFYLIQNDNLVGLLDSNLNVAAPLIFDKIKLSQKYNRIYFKKGTSSGYFIIGSATTKTLPETDSLTEISDSLLLSWKGDSCLLLNLYFDTLSVKHFRNASKISDTSLIAFDRDSLYYYQLARKVWTAKKEKVWRLLNDTLGLIKEDTLLGVHHFQSDSIFMFEGDTAWQHPLLKNRLLTKKGMYLGLAALEGRLLANYNRCLSYIGKPQNGFMEVISKKKYGFIDTNGYLLIATQYDSVKPVVDGHAAIKLKGKWGYVDRRETIVIQPNYSNATVFMGKTAPVWIGALATLADDKGKELFKPRFHYIYPTRNGYWLSKRGNLYGFLQSDGTEIFNPRFSRVKETDKGYYIVTQYERTAILNKKLETVFPFEKREVVNITGSAFFYFEDKQE